MEEKASPESTTRAESTNMERVGWLPMEALYDVSKALNTVSDNI
jgi:hypothetical protein